MQTYFSALSKEIENARHIGEDYQVCSVFFGGGTPSAVDPIWIGRLMEQLHQMFTFVDAPEISMEVNPGTVTEEKLRAYKQAGINRLSFGLQSTEDAELKRLGRIHTYDQFVDNYQLARKLGFTNLSVDLMSGLPGQTTEQWKHHLRRIVQLKPEHISAYSLIVEPGTPYYEQYGEDDRRRAEGEEPKWLPSEEDEREMAHETRRYLAEQGYEAYEISNYARSGYRCQHNDGYWIRRDYIGFGLGAASLLGDCRMQNTSDMEAYCNGEAEALRERTNLTPQDIQEEVIFLGLRRMEGVTREHFREQTGKELLQVYGPVIQKLQKGGFLEADSKGVRLTEQGLDLANYCMREFLLEKEEL